MKTRFHFGDYIAHITYENLLDLIEDDLNRLRRAEKAAYSEADVYLWDSYHLDTILPQFDVYDNTANYLTGAYVIYYNADFAANGVTVSGIFKCIADSTGNLPTDTDFWVLEDPRETNESFPFILHLLLDITLYRIAKTQTPAEQVDQWETHYKEAVKMLEKIQKNKMAIRGETTENQPGKTNLIISPKSNGKINNNYDY